MAISVIVSRSEKGFQKCAFISAPVTATITRRSEVLYLLLVGGDKSSQKRDIKRALEMVRALKKE